MSKLFKNQSFELECINSCLDNIVFDEIVDINVLDKLINSDLLRRDFHNPQAQHQWENERQQLIEYRKKITREGIAKVKYTKARAIKWGRVHPENAVGLFSFRREIRQTLAKPNYIDIDIENAYPKFLTEIFEKNREEIPTIFTYVENREKILNDVMVEYKVNREEAKKLFLILLHFGGFDRWYNTIMEERYMVKLNGEIEETDEIEKFKKVKKRLEEDKKNLRYDDWLRENDYNNKRPNKFIIDFINDREAIGNTIMEHNPVLLEAYRKRRSWNNKMKVKDTTNEIGGVVSYFLQEIEFQVLDTVYEYCVKNGYITNEKNPVLCYDGIMLHKSLYEEKLLKEFSRVVNERFGFNLKFAVKDMNQDYLDILDKHIWCEEKILNDEEKKKDEDDFWEMLGEMSEYKMAEEYYKLNKNKYLFQEGVGWFCYNSNNTINHTKIAPVEMGNSIARDLLKLLKDYSNRLDPSDKDYLKKQKLYVSSVKKIGSDKVVKGIVNFLRDFYKVERLIDKIDNNVDLLAFDNMLYDFSIKQFREIRKEDYIATTTKYNINPQINYDIREDILKTIASIFPDNEMVDFFLTITGLSLFGNKYEKFYIHTGSGGNGKGLLSTMLEKALGDYYIEVQHTFLTTKFEGNTPNPDLYNSKGKRYLNVTEPESNKITDEITLNTEFVKKITGNDTIVARKLNVNPISFKGQFTPNLQCNNMPKMKRPDGMERRLIKIDYPYNFVANPNKDNMFEKQRDITLKDKYQRIDYAIQYLLLLIDKASQFNGSDIIPPASVSNSTLEYFNTNNPVYKWINKYYIYGENNMVGSAEEKKKYKTGIQRSILLEEFNKNNPFSQLKPAEFYNFLNKCNQKITATKSVIYVRDIRRLTEQEVNNRNKNDDDDKEDDVVEEVEIDKLLYD